MNQNFVGGLHDAELLQVLSCYFPLSAGAMGCSSSVEDGKSIDNDFDACVREAGEALMPNKGNSAVKAK